MRLVFAAVISSQWQMLIQILGEQLMVIWQSSEHAYSASLAPVCVMLLLNACSDAKCCSLTRSYCSSKSIYLFEETRNAGLISGVFVFNSSSFPFWSRTFFCFTGFYSIIPPKNSTLCFAHFFTHFSRVFSAYCFFTKFFLSFS